MLIFNNNGDSLYTRSHTKVDSVPPDQVCVVYLGGEGINEVDSATKLTDIIANEVILDMPDIPNIANYAYVYNGISQRIPRNLQFEKNQGDIFIRPNDVDVETKKIQPHDFYITKTNINRIFKTKIIPSIESGEFNIRMFVDGDASKLTDNLRKKLNDFAKTKTDADVAKKIKTITSKNIFAYEKMFLHDEINALFEQTILPRITDKNGKKLSVNTAAKNIRKMNFIAHCHGAYMVLRLYEKMTDKLTELGYSKTDIKQIQSQMLVVALNPACPLVKTNATIINFTSAYDTIVPRSQNWLNDFLNKYMSSKQDWKLQPGFLAEKNGNVFYVKQRFELAPDGNISYNEHNNMHYYHESLTSHGRIMMQLSRNIIMSGIRNSCAQTGGKLVPLPELNKLILDGKNDAEIKKLFTQMKQNGAKLISAAYKHATAVVGTRTKTKMPQTKTQSR